MLINLPPKGKRAVSENIFQIGNIFKKYASEPDYYICYNAGYWARWLSILFAVVILLIISSHKYLGLFSEIMPKSNSQNYLELYSYLISFTGYIFFIFIAYYLYFFLKVIDFNKYNYLRDVFLPPGSVLDAWPRKKLRNLSALCAATGIVMSLFPSISTQFFYKAIFDGYFEQYFNSLIFIYFIATAVIMIQSTMAVLAISCILMCLSIQFEIRKRKIIDDDTSSY